MVVRPASIARRTHLRLQHSVGPKRSTSGRRQSVRKEPDMLDWDAQVAREARYEARIEAAFDQADTQARIGNLEDALG